MSDQLESFQRNKILNILQGSLPQAGEKNFSSAPASPEAGDSEQFIYPYISELDQLLRRFKERHSKSASDNSL